MPNYVLTAIAHGETLPIEPAELASDLSSKLGVTLIKHIPLSLRACDIYVNHPTLTVNEMRAQVPRDNMDIAVQHVDSELNRTPLKLCVFDMDSTLIYQEVIELIAAYAGVEPEVHAITERAMNNELDFQQSLRARVRLLRGLEIEQLYGEIKQKLRITKGVPELCATLREHGVKLAVLSGGFIQFAEFIRDQLHLDFARANLLETDEAGKLTGEVVGDIVDGECKAATVRQLSEQWSIPVEQACMIGDGGNDLPAMRACGFGIAWNAKPVVQEQAPARLNTDSLADALYIFNL
ncbi:Phosphoserine phosphatase [Nakaseomyces bracarensis]|uniref:phosphoserine phosphatase n=1 Tax=Nakaseomyces bracarensis TaxID=273131 RepID=A0ABR4NWE1_9SACH